MTRIAPHNRELYLIYPNILPTDIYMRKTIDQIEAQDTPIVCLTAYTAPVATQADPYCDLLLVGDSLSMVIYGEPTTQSANMEMMIRHGKAVVKATKNAVVIIDMPYGSYEESPLIALQNAQRLIDETGCCGVKLEGGVSQAETIKFLTNNDIPVMGHVGLLPQSVSSPDGYRVQGRENDGAQQLMQDAKAVQEAGAFSVVVEAVPEPLAAAITASINIPTIGIGASNACDGQILVTEDILGLSLGTPPKFVKQYANLEKASEQAIESYAREVKNRQFPTEEHTYKSKNQNTLKKAS